MQALFKQQITWRSGRRIWTTLGDVWTSAKVREAVLEDLCSCSVAIIFMF